MANQFDDASENYIPGQHYSSTTDELEERIAALEGSAVGLRYGNGIQYGEWIYLLGLILGMILSWSRNTSILLCIGHGLASWIYVIYFAVTR